MAKIDLNAMNIEELIALRDSAIDKLAEKVAARQSELQAELDRLSQFGKTLKKSQVVAPVTKAKKGDEKKSDEARIEETGNNENSEAVARAA